MIGRLAILSWLVMVLCSSAPAAPWQVSYEGDDFPENQGWTRECYGPWARSLADGILTLDSSADWTVFDYYYMDLPSPIAPGPGEYLYVDWGIRVTGPDDARDNGIYVFNDAGGAVTIKVGPDTVADLSDPQVRPPSAPIAPGEFHRFLLTTHDVSAYELYVDDEFVFAGELVPNGAHFSWIGFGDGVQGGLDLSVGEWDYVRFGVVPEPGALLVLLTGALGPIAQGRRCRGEDAK